MGKGLNPTGIAAESGMQLTTFPPASPLSIARFPRHCSSIQETTHVFTVSEPRLRIVLDKKQPIGYLSSLHLCQRTSGSPLYKFSLTDARSVLRGHKCGPMLTITKEFIFHAAHRLFSPSRSIEENLQIYGNCAKLHGHTYRLQVTLAGQPDETGMILHFDELKQLVRRELLDRYDHANLNDLPEYRQTAPTAENMVEHMFLVLDRALRSKRFHLEQILLYETPTAWATRSRE